VNFNRPRYTTTSGQPPRDGEANTYGEETDKCTHETGRGKQRERALERTDSKLWETRSSSRQVRRVLLEINNQFRMFGRESDGPVVAVKWSNVHGAKGPWLHTCKHL
jgi:hypothetical protein